MNAANSHVSGRVGRISTVRRRRVDGFANVDAVLAAAAELLARRGERFTNVRRSVLQLLYQEQKAVGAYDLVPIYEKALGRRIVANTVYRALDFLEQQGLVAHLANTRTYVAREPHEGREASLFFVCRRCAVAIECDEPKIQRAVGASACAVGFIAHARAIDVEGICKACSQDRISERDKTNCLGWKHFA